MPVRMFFVHVFLLLVILVPSSIYSKELPFPPEDEMQKRMKVLASETGTEQVERYYLVEGPVMEKIRYKWAVPAGKNLTTSWEDKGSRWECTESCEGRPVHRRIYFKRSFNATGNLAGRRVDDIFSDRYRFKRVWDFQDRKVLARTLADNHFLQVLIVSRQNQVILQEVLLSDPEYDAENIDFLQDAAKGSKLLVHVFDRSKGNGRGNLFLLKSATGEAQLLGRTVDAFSVSLSPSRSLAAFIENHEGGRGELAVVDLARNKTIVRKELALVKAGHYYWSSDETMLVASFEAQGEARAVKVDLKKNLAEEIPMKALTIALTPSGKNLYYQAGGGSGEIPVIKAADNCRLLPDDVGGGQVSLADNSLLSLQDGVLWKLTGKDGREKMMDHCISYAVNDSRTSMACYAGEGKGTFLNLVNLKTQDQLPLMMGGRPVSHMRWHGSLLNVVLEPRNVTYDEPVVLLFNEKGDAVPLAADN